jgi:hypothetical protein
MPEDRNLLGYKSEELPLELTCSVLPGGEFES